MDFFAQQDRARAKTRTLILYFILAIVAIIASIYAVTLTIFFQNSQHPEAFTWWQPEILFWVAIGTGIIISIGTLYKILELRAGGQAVATMLGGRPVNLHTTNPDERKLLNVVEEMSIASGVPTPTVYILDFEDGINAFAAGFDRSDAVIGVTKGCISTLTRDELQGVIAHEFSHILNGDMNLNIRLMGVLHGILLIAMIGRVLMRTNGTVYQGRDGLKKNSASLIILFGLALLLIGYIGVFFANLIKSAVSRQREFLADASSVQFTRNPGGITGALKKIGRTISRLSTPQAEQASHMFFADGIEHFFMGLFATHPPLEERIRAIDPSFDGNFPVLITPESLKQSYTKTTPSHFIDSAGNVSQNHLYYAQAMNAAIPDPLRISTRDALGAQAIIYSLLLNHEPAIRAQQLAELTTAEDKSVLDEIQKISAPIAHLPHALILPLIDLSIPALRMLSPDQYQSFCAKVDALIAADQAIDLFEYTLKKMLFRHLDIHFGLAKAPKIAHHTLTPILREAVILLSALANMNGTLEERHHAFQLGLRNLEIHPKPHLTLLARSESDLPAVDAALDKLAAAAPFVRKNVLFACATTVMSDNQVSQDEGDLLRAIADTLDCPIPPIIGNAGQMAA